MKPIVNSVDREPVAQLFDSIRMATAKGREREREGVRWKQQSKHMKQGDELHELMEGK